MSQLADCKSMLISAEQRSDMWFDKEQNLDIVLETMEIFLDSESIVEILERVKEEYSKPTFKEEYIKNSMLNYLNVKIHWYKNHQM